MMHPGFSRWERPDVFGGARNGGSDAPPSNSGDGSRVIVIAWGILIFLMLVAVVVFVVFVSVQTTIIRKDSPPHCFRIFGTGPDVLPGPGEPTPFAPEFGGIIKGEIEVGDCCIRWNLIYINMTSDPLHLHLHGPLVGNATQVAHPFVDLGVDELVTVEGEPGNGTITRRRCLEVTYEQEFAIVARPEAFYLDAHSDNFPDGALRSPLGTRCGGGI